MPTTRTSLTHCSLVALDPVEVLAISPKEVERVVGRHGGTEFAVHGGDGHLVDDVGIVVDAVGTDAVGRGARVVAQVRSTSAPTVRP